MDNMLIVALMVVSCILINPLVSATEVKKVAAAEEQADDTQSGESDEDEESEETY